MTLRETFATASLATLAAALAAPPHAHAWWRGGVFFGFPPIAPFYYAPPPVFYPPPPVIYAPPPAAYAPPPAYATPPAYAAPPGYAVPPPSTTPQDAAGPVCRAGLYVCPLDAPAAVGSPCSCPTNTGRAAGRVG